MSSVFAARRWRIYVQARRHASAPSDNPAHPVTFATDGSHLQWNAAILDNA
ncbi:hypothetical protein AAFN47_16005 [Hoeflea sp. CAU 1731]